MIVDSSPPGEGASAPQERGTGESRLSSVPEAFEYLMRAANSRGRDMKLVTALLHSMADFLLAHGVDATITASTDTNEGTPGRNEEERNAAAAGHLRASISPALRSRLHAVIDSLSDDETARLLMIGIRQVRRRALAGSLYYFDVGRKRRYPCWQFIGGNCVLPGLRDVTPVLPKDWPPETVSAFMTIEHPNLLIQGVSSSPVEWLVHGGEPSIVSRLLGLGSGDQANDAHG